MLLRDLGRQQPNATIMLGRAAVTVGIDDVSGTPTLPLRSIPTTRGARRSWTRWMTRARRVRKWLRHRAADILPYLLSVYLSLVPEIRSAGAAPVALEHEVYSW